MRLNRFIAQSGVTSRRKAEELIAAGRVTLNGRTAAHPATEVKPGDTVLVDGKAVAPPEQTTTIALYKPRGVTTSLNDPHAKKTVIDLLPKELPRLNPVGRLDRESEGLLLLTNDGDLHQQLTHPSFEHEKEYLVKIRGAATDAFLKRMAGGIKLDEGHTGRSQVTRVDEHSFLIIIHQGWKRQIRRMVETAGAHVTLLKRVRIGRLTLGEMEPGSWRPVTKEEII